MKYSELVDSGATPTEIQTFLVGSENVPVTMRIPRTCAMRQRRRLS